LDAPIQRARLTAGEWSFDIWRLGMDVSPTVESEKKPYVYGSSAYRWYVLLVLALIYTCHSIDRGMPNILLEPIRHEFHLSDAQLGLFSGLGFALAFSVTILPMGYISDRTNRRNFLAVIVLGWSICTALGGFARSYIQLVLARVGVGAAESGAAPVALPMISDIFPVEKRGSAIGIFYISNAVGLFVANIVGGYVAAEHGWRAAFFIAGIPGLFLAVLLWTTVREPRRGGSEAGALQDEAAAKPPKLREVFTYLLRSPGLICLILACAIMGMVAITINAWLGSFFVRIHHLNLKQVGLILGAAGGLGGVISPVLMGWLGDKLSVRDIRGPLLMVAVGALLSMSAGMVQLFTPSVALAVTMLICGDIFRIGYTSPAYAVLMNNTPVLLRGTMMSIMQLTTNIFGFGVGPLLVGVLSDLHGGQGALRYAMANALVLLVLAAVLFVATVWLLYGFGSRRKALAAATSSEV
jgi:predicted MFS family arabinose efflux permease